MKSLKTGVVVLILFIFISTNVASAFSAPTLDLLSGQLQTLMGSLSKLINQRATVAATAPNSLSPQVIARTCQVGLVSVINGKKSHSTTTISGQATDEFAIGLSVGVDPIKLPFTKRVQTGTWGTKTEVTATVGYFTPVRYKNQKAVIDALAADPHYTVATISLDNVNNPNSDTTLSEANPFAEAKISNGAVTGAAAGKVTLIANVSNCTGGTVTSPVQDPKQPNILFVMADDLDMQTLMKLPKIKLLMSDKGMTFEKHFSSLSSCCPSRAATLTGTYAHNNGVFTNNAVNADGSLGGYAAFVKADNESKTMAVWLQNAGYKTALMGKYMNGYSSDVGTPYTVPQGWSEWVVPIDGNPYSEYNYTLNVNGVPEEHYLPYCTKKGDGKNCLVDRTKSTAEERRVEFLTNVLNRKAQAFITKNSKTATPFFLYLAPFAPHGPSTPAPRFENTLSDTAWLAKHPLPKTTSFNEADVSDKPTWLKDNAGLLTPRSIEKLTSIYQKRVISMYAVEDMLSDLIDTLTANGQLDNTYIVFTSDNGFHLGQHRLEQGKLTEFDTDINIPLIIRGPGVEAGSASAQLTANVDIAPTLASLAGLPIPATVDGRSFKETLLGGTSIPRNALLIEHGNPANPAQIMTLENSAAEPRDTEAQNSPIVATDYVGKYTGLRTPQYTYVRYEKNGEEELYDNVNDPEQLNNVAATAGDTFMSRLSQWTKDLSTCKGAQCRTIEGQNRLDGIKGALDGKACFYDNKQINNGTSQSFYTKRTVEPGASCEAVKQVRTCTDGKLSGSDTYSIDSCTVLERFTGVNFNQNPENLDLGLMNQAGATWMRANASILPYYKAGATSFPDWDEFKAAHTTGKKGIVNLMWDFERYGETIPAPDSEAEKALFAYLDTVVLPQLLPSADIIVSGNEPFVNTLSSDWGYKSSLGDAPIAVFYKRVTEHLHEYMVAQGVRNKHKLYVGAFTRLYDDTMRTGKASYAVKSMLTYADEASYVDGVDIHTHVGAKTFAEIESSLKFATKYTDKPIANTEYTYVHSQADHLQESLNVNDTKPFDGKTFAETFKRDGNMLVIDYMKILSRRPVTKEEWHGFLKSRSWTVDHFLLRSNDIFKRYAVNGATFGFMQSSMNFKNPLPWYMGFLYSSTTVKHLPNGQPEGNYQYLEDFISLQKK